MEDYGSYVCSRGNLEENKEIMVKIKENGGSLYSHIL
jgi:hypothetical protein